MVNEMDKTILLVDHDEGTRIFVSDILQIEGYHIIEAGSVEEAYAGYHQNKPFLIIMGIDPEPELELAFLEGLDVQKGMSPGVIILIEHTDNVLIRRCFDVGASAFLDRMPQVFQLKALVGTLDSLYNRETPAPELPAETVPPPVQSLCFTEEDIREIREKIMSEMSLEIDRFHDKEKSLQSEIAKNRESEKRLKKTIRELEDSRRSLVSFKKAVDNIQLGITITDAFGKILYTNPAEARMHGLGVDEIIGADVTILAPESLRRVRSIEEVREQKGSIRESRNVRHDGVEFPVRLVSDLVEEGNEVFIVTVSEDITDRLRMEAEIRHQYQFLQVLIDEIPHPVYYKTIDDMVLGCNREFEMMLGKRAKDIIGRQFLEQVPYGITEIVREKERQLLDHGEKIVFDLQFFFDDGFPRDLQITETLFLDEEGRNIGIIGVFIDLSDKARVQKQLEFARREAEDANMAKSRFLSHIIHEIRTPLNSVMGMVTLLRDTPLDPVQADYLDILHINGDALLTIINDILDFAKIESGKLDLNPRAFNLHHCIEQSIDIMSPKANEKVIDIGYMIGDGVPVTVDTDDGRLRQILLNLLSNGVKYTKAGYVSLQVDSVALATDKHRIHFAVTDTGAGIPKEQISTIFQAFRSSDLNRRDDFDGVGLGLGISRNLTQLLGGDIWVESEVDKGSTFHFTITVKVPEEQDSLPYLDDLHTGLFEKHILVVGNRHTETTILPYYIDKWSMVPVRAETATEALRWLTTDRSIEGVILSQQVPDMAFTSLIREIRQQGLNPHVPIIMLGMKTQLNLIPLEERNLVTSLISKPLKPLELYRALLGSLHLGTIKEPPKPPVPEFDRTMGERMPRRILLVEDSVFNQKVALSFLRKLGYEADIVTDGLEIMNVVRKTRYDILFMDINMPGMSGAEATMIIRRDLPTAQQPYIIALTSNAMNGVREDLIRLGMNDYISKPIQVNDFIRVLEKALGETMASASVPEMVDLDVGLSVDFSTLDNVIAQLGEDAEDIIMTYLEQAPNLTMQMREAWSDGNCGRLNRLAHSLKANSATLGIVSVSRISESIEHETEDGDLPEIEERVDTLDRMFDSVGNLFHSRYLNK